MTIDSIQTVRGPIDSQTLGVTLTHEHVAHALVSFWEPQDDEALWELALEPFRMDHMTIISENPHAIRDVRDLAPHLVVDELRKARQAGVESLVEMTPIGLGRNPKLLALISRLSGINIIMATGLYHHRYHPIFTDLVSDSFLTDLFVKELTEGVGSTGLRAGVIGEIGCSNPVTDQERKVLRAAARAQKETGVALNLHRSSFPDPNAALEGVDLVLSLGVDPGKLIVSHCDERPERGFADEVLRRGAYAEFDTFGWDRLWIRYGGNESDIPVASDGQRVASLVDLLEKGHVDRLLVSQDVAYKPHLRQFGGQGYDYISRSIERRLLLAGVSADAIHQMRVENPRLALTPS